MKKSLMFVAVAAAGMLASCSSDSLTAGSDPTIESGQKDLVPIEIGVATPMARSGMTRGTGTVGAVEDGSGNAVNNDGTDTGTPKANIWAGQKVNVYMFNQGTLELAKFDGANIFDNAVMDTPPASETTDDGLAHYVDPDASGRYLVKYYPLSGAYDFWGYRIDDAQNAAGTDLAGAPVKNGEGDKYQVEIKVDGSQDVLGAKTTVPDLAVTTLTTADLYSAKAARQGIQPKLDFNHLMTRLTFEAYPGNANAKSVYVTGIKVRAIHDATTDPNVPVYQTPVGTLDIAGTEDGFKQKINWVTSTDAPDPFVLMKRQEAVLGKDAYSGIAADSWYALTAAATDNNQFITKTAYDAIDKIKTDYEVLAAGSWYSSNADPTNVGAFISKGTYDAAPGTYENDYSPIAADSWYGRNDDLTVNANFISATAYEALPEHAQGEYTLLAADSWYALAAAATDNTQFISATAYGNLPATSTAGDTDGNMNLIALTDGSSNWATNGAVSMTFGTGATDGSEKASIGESIIAPDAAAYEIEIDLAQKVAKYEGSDVAVPTDWSEYTFNSIKTIVKASDPTSRFEIGKSYDIIFKVYGLEKIQVSTVLNPWIWGENIDVVTE